LREAARRTTLTGAATPTSGCGHICNRLFLHEIPDSRALARAPE
jgi:hypothetical protein